MRTYNAAAKFIESIADDFDNEHGTARGTLNEGRYTLKAVLGLDSHAVTAMLFDYGTMKLTQINDAKAADFRTLAKTATGTWKD